MGLPPNDPALTEILKDHSIYHHNLTSASSLPSTHKHDEFPFLGSPLPFFHNISSFPKICNLFLYFLSCQSPPQDWKPQESSNLCIFYSLTYAKHPEKYLTLLGTQ